MGLREEWLESRRNKHSQKILRDSTIRDLTVRFSQMFPEAPKGQGRFIAVDACDNGSVVHDMSLPITDRVYLMTFSFLRHQFYYKLHYGNKEKRNEANHHALEIMRGWGYKRKQDNERKDVNCPACLGNKCDFCGQHGVVPQWVAWNYELRSRFQQEE